MLFKQEILNMVDRYTGSWKLIPIIIIFTLFTKVILVEAEGLTIKSKPDIGYNSSEKVVSQTMLNSPNSAQINAEQITINLNRLEFRPLRKDLRQKIVESLRINHGNLNQVSILVNTNGAGKGRYDLGQELVDIFGESEIEAKLTTNATISADPLPPVKVHFNKNDQKQVFKAFSDLGVLLNVKAAGYTAPDLEPGIFQISLMVDPLFNSDGSVDF